MHRVTSLFHFKIFPLTMQISGEKYDYHMEVANTGFGDMLHDRERNQKYYSALRKTIASMHDMGKTVHVLDIGTGTGILAMMAAAAGADHITACEAFLPMANCADRIFNANGVKVHLIKKRSNDIKIGDGLDDMKCRANLLVTELLDTELIGEGALSIYNHAHSELLTEDVICIPNKANCYVQVAQSPLAAQWNSFKSLANLDGEVLLKPSEEIVKCKSEATLHDIQLSQLPLNQFRPITEPVKIFEFDFGRKLERELERNRNLHIKTNCPGSTDFVFYWWDIELDRDGEICLSCAPFWTHPDFRERSDSVQKLLAAGIPMSNCIPWRDHWMQAIYYIPKPLHFTQSDTEFILSCNHDEFSLWFDAFPSGAKLSDVPRHSCTCQFHMTYARSRIGQLNQSQRSKRYLRYLEESINIPNAHILTLGDGCILGLCCAKLGATKIISHEPHRHSRQFMTILSKTNGIDNVEFVEKLEDIKEDDLAKLTHVFAEPYFMTSILPWDNLYFGTLLSKIISKLPKNIKISPNSARIHAVPVEFIDLHLIRKPVGNCEGFDLRLFDEMIQASSALAQTEIEAQPLWEYPCRALAQPTELLSIKFDEFNKSISNSGQTIMEFSGSCNGIVIWVDWCIDGENNSKSFVSTGPSEPFTPGDFIKWDMFVRQGVQLISNPKTVKNAIDKLYWTCKFDAMKGQLQFDFDVKNDS